MPTFQVPVAKATTSAAHFDFSLPRKRRWWWPFDRVEKHSIPLVQYLEPELVVAMAGSVASVTKETVTEESAKVIWETQLAVLDHYAPSVRERLTDDQLVAIFRAYYEASNIQLGESSASSGS